MDLLMGCGGGGWSARKKGMYYSTDTVSRSGRGSWLSVNLSLAPIRHSMEIKPLG
jgi:hypothetical protein